MFTIEQKRLADAQVAFLTAAIQHRPGECGSELAEILGMDYVDYCDLVWSNQPGEGKIERLAEMTALVASA